jgi:hypothetical protein
MAATVPYHDGARKRRHGRRERACQNRLAGARQSADRGQTGSGRLDQCPGKLKISACLVKDAGVVGIRRPQPCQRHLGADRRTNRHEHWQGTERIEIFERHRGKIPIQDGIGGQRLVVVQQIHQSESEVVEHVDSRHLCVELYGIEQHGLLLDQYDIREMQVAVATAHEAPATALLQQGAGA